MRSTIAAPIALRLAGVVAVHVAAAHDFSKGTTACIELVPGHGVRGDAHFGRTVQHRSRVAKDPSQRNLRQVHLLHEELLFELRARGFSVAAGQLGENISTRGIDLLALGVGTRLRLGGEAVVEITGLRNPCVQIERFMPGLLAAVLDRGADGELVRKAGVMGVVQVGGVVRAGDGIEVMSVPAARMPLRPV